MSSSLSRSESTFVVSLEYSYRSRPNSIWDEPNIFHYWIVFVALKSIEVYYLESGWITNDLTLSAWADIHHILGMLLRIQTKSDSAELGNNPYRMELDALSVVEVHYWKIVLIKN